MGTRLLTLALAIFLLSASALQAAEEPAGPEDGFDPAKLETRGGVIKAIKTIPSSSRNGYIGPGLRLAVQCGEEILDVPLGPKWFVDRQPLKLAEGDEIVITGVRPDQKRLLFLVSEIKKEKAVGCWRDRDGFLYWKKVRAVEAQTTPRPRPRRSGRH